MANTGRIVKRLLLCAPRSRVWEALADADQFGRWFQVKLDGPFLEGARIRGRILHPGYEHVPFHMTIERLEPERLFSWRWHPNSVDPAADYSNEPTTVVVFELEELEDGTLLTMEESGFEGIPLTRLMDAYRGNEQGWTEQFNAIEQYLGIGD
ncbi:MAG: SRPBCC family protein [Chloroflexota bacterium]